MTGLKCRFALDNLTMEQVMISWAWILPLETFCTWLNLKLFIWDKLVREDLIIEAFLAFILFLPNK